MSPGQETCVHGAVRNVNCTNTHLISASVPTQPSPFTCRPMLKKCYVPGTVLRPRVLRPCDKLMK